MQHEYSQSTGQKLRGIETFEKSENTTSNQSTLFAAGFHARTSAMQDAGQDSTVSEADFSLRQCESLAKWDQASLSWRTSQRCLLGGWIEFSGHWPRSGLMLNGIAYRQPPLVPLMHAKDYSFWPTPTASDGRRAKLKLSSLQKSFNRKSLTWLTGPAQGNLSEHIASECDCYLSATLGEWIMGFPKAWTGLKESETQ